MHAEPFKVSPVTHQHPFGLQCPTNLIHTSLLVETSLLSPCCVFPLQERDTAVGKEGSIHLPSRSLNPACRGVLLALGWPASSKQNSRNKVNELTLIIFKCERLLVLLTTASWPAAMSWCFSKGLHSRQTLDVVSCRLRRFPWNSCKSVVKATILHESHPLRATYLAQTFAPYYDHGLSSTSLPFFTAIVLS